MLRKILTMVAVVTAVIGIAFAAQAADLSMLYLKGHWSFDGPEKCGVADADYLKIQANGTFETGLRGEVKALGFWEVKGDLFNLHMITSPSFFWETDAALKAFEGQYHYFDVKFIVFNVEANRFETVGALGNEMRKATLDRCP